ncbi:MAG: hypothetical protein LBB68_09650 [Treponema sp.]|jgi:hypothetical protein|nr:hypothetical protein [Treponema sp.]
MKGLSKNVWVTISLALMVLAVVFPPGDGMIKGYARLAGMAGAALAMFLWARSSGKGSAVREGWDKAAAFTVFMFICHGGALLFFLPAIFTSIGIGPALAILVLSSSCWAALLLLLIQYKKRVFPVNIQIEKVIHNKPLSFPPKPIVEMYRKIKIIEGNIRSLQEISKATKNYIRVLSRSKGVPGTGSLMEKQKEYDKYFDANYAEYCSLDLHIRFQFYVTLIKEVLIPGGMIPKLNIEGFIEAVKTDLRSRMKILVEGNDPGTDGAVEFAGLDESMKVIEKKILRITSYLISTQSSETIAGTSPVEEKKLLDIYKQEYDFETAFERLKKPDDEHDRFMAERELLEP